MTTTFVDQVLERIANSAAMRRIYDRSLGASRGSDPMPLHVIDQGSVPAAHSLGDGDSLSVSSLVPGLTQTMEMGGSRIFPQTQIRWPPRP